MSLETSAARFPRIAERLSARAIKVRIGKLLARWLLSKARHGEAVQLAIFLSRLTGDRSQTDDLYVLGRHPQFWMHAANALHQFGMDAVDLGWGRLARGAAAPA